MERAMNLKRLCRRKDFVNLFIKNVVMARIIFINFENERLYNNKITNEFS